MAGAGYLNAASLAALPECAARAVREFDAARIAPHTLQETELGRILHRARAAAARMVGADPDEIALGGNTSFGVNLAAAALPLERGSTIVLSAGEFPANVYPWMRLEAEGVRVEVVPTRADGAPDEARLMERLARGDVSCFALSAVQFASGYAADLPRFGALCRERGIHFVVDAIQALGQVPIDVRDAGVDILATGGHKWLCSPFGTGFVYVRRELHARMEPRAVGWASMEASQDLSSVVDYRYELLADARRFEVATLPFQDLAGMTVSIEMLLAVGVDRIREHLLGILEPLVRWVQEHPRIRLVGDAAPERRSGIVCLVTPDVAKTHAALSAAGIVCGHREGAVRIAPHLYNTEEEISRVREILEKE